jgi:hypothetical protein
MFKVQGTRQKQVNRTYLLLVPCALHPEHKGTAQGSRYRVQGKKQVNRTYLLLVPYALHLTPYTYRLSHLILTPT